MMRNGHQAVVRPVLQRKQVAHHGDQGAAEADTDVHGRSVPAQSLLSRALHLAGMAQDPIAELRVWNAYAMLAHQRGEHIEAARKGQTGARSREQKAGSTASSASLATDLELTRTELRKVREERDRLKAAVQRGLGQQVDQVGSAEQVTRIQELNGQLQQRDSELTAARAEAERLRAELEEAQDNLGGLRLALKQMMRDNSA